MALSTAQASLLQPKGLGAVHTPKNERLQHSSFLQYSSQKLLVQVPRCRPSRSRSQPSASALPNAQAAGQQQLLVTPEANNIRAARRRGPPAISPLVFTPYGPVDMMTTLSRNRIIFIGSPVDGRVAQSVISQLVTLATQNENEDIKMYINSPGGSTYSVLAIYDAMCWVKPDIETVAFGLVASQSALLLAAGTKGKRFAMPNARIMIHQPQGGAGGTLEDVRRQADELMLGRLKFDELYSAFTGKSVPEVQKHTERDRFFSAAEACDFGLIDEILYTRY